MDREEIALKQGDIVSSGNYDYCIVSVKNMGATCIVYEAEYTDNSQKPHAVYLKECCPDKAAVFRKGTKLVWEQGAGENALAAFSDTYDKLIVWQENISAVTVFDKFETNGTQYICMPKKAGESILSVTYKDIKTMLETIKSLTRALKLYHDNGYLHLDIKPDNFLVFPENPGAVLLFDMDTIVPIKDIDNGKKVRMPFSEGWSAPEQTGSIYDKPAHATDIYAIGAILFRKIMNRVPKAKDRGCFAHWCFPEELFKDINPVVKTKIENIFRKTLAIHQKDRYQKAEELIYALEDVIKSIDKPFITSRFNKPQRDFLGRKDELHQIDAAFIDNDVVILQGEPGVGKSELAKKYAESNVGKYDKILQLNYKGSLKDLLSGNDLLIHNCDTETFDEKEKQLSDIMQADNILFIIDNANEAFELDEYRKTFFGIFRAKFLITTKCTNFEHIFSGTNVKAKKIKVGALLSEELKVLFVEKCSRVLDDEEYESIDNILTIVDGCTLLVPVLARYTDHLTVEELAERLQGGLRALKGEVSVNKDDDFYHVSPLEILKIVWNWEARSSMEEAVLQTMCFLRNIMLSRRGYCEYLKPSGEDENEHLKVINSLVERGWIQEAALENERFPEITLHSLVVEMIQSELCMDISKNRVLTAYVDSTLPLEILSENEGLDALGVNSLEMHKIANWGEWFVTICEMLDFDITENVAFVAMRLSALINGSIHIAHLLGYRTEDTVIKKLHAFLENGKGDIEILFKIANIIETICAELAICSDALPNDAVAQRNLLRSFKEAEELANEMDAQIRPGAIWLVCKPIMQIAEHDRDCDFCPAELLETALAYDRQYPNAFPAHNLWPTLFDAECHDIINKYVDQLFVSENNQMELDKVTDYITIESPRVREYIHVYKSNYDIHELDRMIRVDESLVDRERDAIYYGIVLVLFPNSAINYDELSIKDRRRAFVDIEKSFKNTDWQLLYSVLQHWRNFQQENGLLNWYSQTQESYRIATTVVVEGDSADFCSEMRHLFEQYKTNLDAELEGSDDWSELTKDRIEAVLFRLWDIGKAVFAQEYLEDCIDHIQLRRKDFPKTSDKVLFYLYKTTAQNAFWANDDATYNKYQRRANALSGKKTIKKSNKTE